MAPAPGPAVLGLNCSQLRVNGRRLGLPDRGRACEEVEHDTGAIETWADRVVDGPLPGRGRRDEQGGSRREQYKSSAARRAERGGRPQRRNAADRRREAALEQR